MEQIDAYFQYYVDLVKQTSFFDALYQSNEETLKVISSIPENKGLYKYEPNKWTVKQLLCHLIDTERIFCYRALRFSRNDKTDLLSFDHDKYVFYDNSDNRSLQDIKQEIEIVRKSTIALFKSFSDSQLKNTGLANGKKLSVESIAYIIAGHETHHVNILKESYL